MKRKVPDLGWRVQTYMLDEGTYEFEVEAIEELPGHPQVLRLRVADGPLEGHRILVQGASPVAGLGTALANGQRFKIRATIAWLRGRGKRFVDAALV